MPSLKNSTVNGLNVAFLLKEVPEPKSTVVFIHGFPFDKSLWNTQLQELPANVQGIAYDVRGFGDSEAGPLFFSIDQFARDLVSLVKTLELERVIVCGISMGGYIALRAMERSPELFSALILCDTTSAADTDTTKLARFDGIEAVQSKGVPAYADNFLKKIFLPEVISEHPEHASFIRDMIVRTPASTICSALLAMASRTDTTPFISSIRVPTLIIRGSDDQVISPGQAAALHAAIPGAELAEIASAGHLPNIEQAEGFNRVIREFLEKLEKG